MVSLWRRRREETGAGAASTALARLDETPPSLLERLAEAIRRRPRHVPQRGYWVGRSGRRFLHINCPIDAVPDVGPANYLIVRHLGNGKVRVLYAGEADDLRRRLVLMAHAARDEAIRAGADHLHLCLAAGGEAERRAIAADLVLRLHPVLNPDPAPRAASAGLAGLAGRRPVHP
ncbi:MAG: hypothetical protein FJX67_11970 [Alphaproteobacteria bacterium]|nr:hypothetical protein [Alphaproteobacteria bacterium]